MVGRTGNLDPSSLVQGKRRRLNTVAKSILALNEMSVNKDLAQNLRDKCAALGFWVDKVLLIFDNLRLNSWQREEERKF